MIRYSESTYASSGDQLTIVQFDALEIMAGLQKVIKASIRDKGTIVQFQHRQMLGCARRKGQLSNALIGDQFTVRQTLRFGKLSIRRMNFFVVREKMCV